MSEEDKIKSEKRLKEDVFNEPISETLKRMRKDPGYCGLDPFITGEYDPYLKDVCSKHDSDFQKKIDGLDHPSLAEVNGDWIVNTTKVALKSIYGATMYPVYLVGGLVGGSIRWLQLSLKRKK